MFRKKEIFSWFCAFLVGNACADAPVNPRTSESDFASREISGDVQSRRATPLSTRIRAIGPTRVNSNGGRVATTITAVRAATPDGRAVSSTRSVAPATRTRVAKKSGATNARTAKNSISGTGGVARSATARATAIFTDVSKIGSGYAACRESYATCMDQMCANANDDYRRCFCSDRFVKFRDIENSLDQAMIMLEQFQDNNLNAVDKTAAEVEAMYSATVGELAIKRDTSAASKALDAINDLLSGKSSSKTYSGLSNSLGVLDFSIDLDNIWSNDMTSIFSSSGTDMSSLEGTALFNAAQRECTRLTQNNCNSDALFSMSRSSYNILITQDCNIYEKNLNKKRETVAKAVRMAEKYLREARLEEYRSHNSADVNECIAKVRDAILADTACGANYKRCLDPTGAYINGATGEAIYTPRLFELEKTINLGGVSAINKDILSQNSAYNKFLDGYRNYVTRELDTCRDIADFVWTEFKRNAIIEIAQAQSEKIEEVKASCVDTMAECYDTQSNALKNMDKNTATTAAALGRYVARDMCYEKVVACAALYGDSTKEGCKFDNRGHLTNSGADCGLTSLLNYVKAVDSLSVADKCEKAVSEYLTKLCTPDNGTYSYPYNCHNMRFTGDNNDNMNLNAVVKRFAVQNCWDPAVNTQNKNYDDLDFDIKARVQNALRGVQEDIRESLADKCRSLGGVWSNTEDNLLSAFYSQVYGGTTTDRGWGYCNQNSAKSVCEMYEEMYEDEDETVVYWNDTTQTCDLYEPWYRHKCAELGDGYYSGGVCYIAN